MNISECADSNGKGKISPNGAHLVLASGLNAKLYLLGPALKLVTKWQVLDEISKLEWSDDGILILCSQAKRGIVQVFSVENFLWTASLNNGICGISNALFTKDSRQVLTYTKQCTRITIWSLTEADTFSISFPKFPKKGISFSSNGKFVGIVVREKNKDVIGIFSCKDWVRTMSIDSDHDIEDIYYMPDNSGVVAWSDSTEYIVTVYDLQGQIISIFSPYSCAPGLSHVQFSHRANFLALCGFNKKMLLLHHFSWVVFQEFQYGAELFNENLVIMKESNEFHPYRIDPSERSKLEEMVTKPSSTQRVLWSGSDSFIVTVLSAFPHIIWVWDMIEYQLKNIIMLKGSLTSMCWNQDVLMWTCGESFVYMWKENEVRVYNQIIPSLYNIQSIGNAVILQGRSQAIYARLIRNR